MPQTVTITSDAYDFDELSDEAKERARDWYREGLHEFIEFDHMFDDFIRVADILGVDINHRTARNVHGKEWTEPCIFFSGFCSQGDGACFEGDYTYKATAPAAIREYAPQDTELHRIADDLSTVQLRNAFGLRARTRHRGHYYHSRSMDIDTYDARDEERSLGEDGIILSELLISFADWMYDRLDAENDYQYSAEAVDDTIRANEYKFTEEGERHAYA